MSSPARHVRAKDPVRRSPEPAAPPEPATIEPTLATFIGVPGIIGRPGAGLHDDRTGSGSRPDPLSVLRRHPETGREAAASVIRRIHDPNVAVNNTNDAVNYITANATALLNGLHQMITVIGGQKTIAEVIALAVDSAQPPVGGSRAAADLMLTQAHGAIPIAPVPNLNAVRVAVRALNYAEREAVTRGALKQDIRTVRIGTEFSFGDGKPDTDEEASVNIKLELPKAPEKESKEAKIAREGRFNRPRTRASLRIADWVKAAAAGGKAIPGEPTIVIGEPDKKKSDYAKKITYTFTQPKDWSWYWVADIDEACYETQTQPTAIGEFANPAISAIITEHIFNLAAGLNLRPDPSASGGGGHLSFDVPTAFGDQAGTVSLELLATTLLTLQADADNLAREFRKDTHGRAMRQRNAQNTADEPIPLDVTNAPSLANQQVRGHPDHDVMEDYTALIGQITTETLKGNRARVDRIQSALVAFNQTLTNPAVTDPERKAHTEHAANISHYQGINIEHLAKPGGSARVEVRDIPAQTDYPKFLQDLKVLQDALVRARDVVDKAQLMRVT